jgi:hypothetical protein
MMMIMLLMMLLILITMPFILIMLLLIPHDVADSHDVDHPPAADDDYQRRHVEHGDQRNAGAPSSLPLHRCIYRR